MNRRILLIMLNFTKGSMKEKKESPTPEVQQTNIPYCKRYRLNHMALCDLLIKEDMADTESVARLFHLYWNNSRQRIRWGVIYNAALDSGLFVGMSPEAFKDMMNNLIPNLDVDRTTVSRGVKEFDAYLHLQQKGEGISAEIVRYLKAKLVLENALRDLIK